MAEATPKRLQQAAKDLNVGMDRVVEALAKKGIQVENKPTTKLTGEQVASLETAKNRVAAGKTAGTADEESTVTHASATETAAEHTPLADAAEDTTMTPTEEAGASSPAEPAQ